MSVREPSGSPSSKMMSTVHTCSTKMRSSNFQGFLLSWKTRRSPHQIHTVISCVELSHSLLLRFEVFVSVLFLTVPPSRRRAPRASRSRASGSAHGRRSGATRPPRSWCAGPRRPANLGTCHAAPEGAPPPCSRPRRRGSSPGCTSSAKPRRRSRTLPHMLPNIQTERHPPAAFADRCECLDAAQSLASGSCSQPSQSIFTPSSRAMPSSRRRVGSAASSRT